MRRRELDTRSRHFFLDQAVSQMWGTAARLSAFELLDCPVPFRGRAEARHSPSFE